MLINWKTEVLPMAKKKPSEPIEFSVDMLRSAGRSAGPLGELSEDARKYVLERYRKFLALAKLHQGERLAPAADIDEMWHLHMLMPRAYATDCQKYFGHILDHNGGFGRKEEELSDLKKIFERTAELWEKEYPDEQYIVAGTASPLVVCFSAATQATVYCHGRA
jgi:hypothetical protein